MERKAKEKGDEKVVYDCYYFFQRTETKEKKSFLQRIKRNVMEKKKKKLPCERRKIIVKYFSIYI